VDFHEIEQCQTAGDLARSAGILAEAAHSLERGGADFIICTNTMHKVADQVQQRIGNRSTARSIRSCASGIILGCTEIGLLVDQKETKAPLFDTAKIHAKRAALYSIGK